VTNLRLSNYVDNTGGGRRVVARKAEKSPESSIMDKFPIGITLIFHDI